jgi:hypothetical protein
MTVTQKYGTSSHYKFLQGLHIRPPTIVYNGNYMCNTEVTKSNCLEIKNNKYEKEIRFGNVYKECSGEYAKMQQSGPQIAA